MSHEPDIVVKQQRKRDRAESPLAVAETKKIRASDGHRDRHYHEDEPQEMGSKRNSRSEKKQEHREQQQRDREGLKAKYEGGGSYETVGKQDHHHYRGHDRKERVSGGRGTEEVHSERGHLEDVKAEYFDSKEVSGDQKHSARHGEAQRDRESRANRHHSKDIGKDNNNSRREREDPKSRDEKDRIRKIEKYSDSAAVSADNEHKRDRESKEKDGHRVLKRKEPRTDETWEKQEKRLRSTHDEDNHDKQQPDTGLSPPMVTINGSSAKDKKDGNGVQVSSNGKTVDMPDSLKASVLPGIVSVVSPNSAAPPVSMPGGQHTSVMGSTDNADKSHTSTPSDDRVPQNASKSEARGEAAPAEKTSTVSLDALAKAKRVLQVQKELAEKLKKLPQLKKSGAETTTALPSTSAVPLAAASLPQAPPTLPPVLPTPPVLPLPGSIPPGIAGGAFFNMPGMLPGLGGLGIPNLGSISSYEAVKRAHEFAVQLGFHQLPGGMPFMPTMVPTPGPDDMGGQQGQPKTVKAPVLRLDAQGREIDEHGNVVDRPKLTNVSTLKVNINKQKKEAFQILRPELEEDPVDNPFFDPRVGIDKKKLIRPKRSSFQFVEEGKWTKQAEMQKLRSQYGEAKAKEMKAKQAALSMAKADFDINPNLIEVSERVPIKEEKPKDAIPDVEWWDAGFLPSKNYEDVEEGRVKMDRITRFVEHPIPIEPPAEPPLPPPQPLKLTKKEQKKLRTQRRLAKEKDRQEMIRQGLLEPPKSKVKMSNLMKVLGAEATQDPTRLEQEIRSAAAEREQAHTDRNLARKLTPAERREKKEKKLFDDATTLETIVSVYRVVDLSHPQTRFKVDINAQENRLTGCVVISDAMCLVVVEGGAKAIKRYNKLMIRRINWAAAIKEETEEGMEDGPRHPNKCDLVWQGSVARPSFDKFLIQQFRSGAAARKYLQDANVGHYWDLAVNFSNE